MKLKDCRKISDKVNELFDKPVIDQYDVVEISEQLQKEVGNLADKELVTLVATLEADNKKRRKILIERVIKDEGKR